ETQRPLAVVIVAGTLSACLLTLVLLPVMYQQWTRGLRREARAAELGAFPAGASGAQPRARAPPAAGRRFLAVGDGFAARRPRGAARTSPLQPRAGKKRPCRRSRSPASRFVPRLGRRWSAPSASSRSTSVWSWRTPAG